MYIVKTRKIVETTTRHGPVVKIQYGYVLPNGLTTTNIDKAGRIKDKATAQLLVDIHAAYGKHSSVIELAV